MCGPTMPAMEERRMKNVSPSLGRRECRFQEPATLGARALQRDEVVRLSMEAGCAKY